MARWQPIDRIVALDEFDMENAAALREHLRIPGMGLTTVRHFRDKLAMRGRAKEDRHQRSGIYPRAQSRQLAGIHVARESAVAAEAALAGFRHRHEENSRRRRSLAAARAIGRRAIALLCSSNSLPGDVFHVDSIVSESKVVFAEAHAYGSPPLDTSHQGGVFTTRTLLRTAPEVKVAEARSIAI